MKCVHCRQPITAGQPFVEWDYEDEHDYGEWSDPLVFRAHADCDEEKAREAYEASARADAAEDALADAAERRAYKWLRDNEP